MSDQVTTNLGGFNMEASYLELSSIFYERLSATEFPSIDLFALNKPLAQKLNLDPEFLTTPAGLSILSGKTPFTNIPHYAQAYAGHQFGHFTILGDGRAKNLGEHIDPVGNRWDIQLKGSGRTPFSRRGDGKAALGPMIREYVISEAMHGLNIPTTRSLAILTTGEEVLRQRVEQGAIMVRIANSHLRVGTFQFAAVQGDPKYVEKLALYAINRHYPELLANDYTGQTRGQLYLDFFRKVVDKQAQLIAQWQSVGFIHGVMNTDNMTISGETIDYGPCAFMNTYAKHTVFSSIDYYGRYAYGNQPDMGAYNLARLADCLIGIIGANEDSAIAQLSDELEAFKPLYLTYWKKLFLQKLGFASMTSANIPILFSLLNIMESKHLDFTNTFKELTLLLANNDVCDYSPGEYTLNDNLTELSDWIAEWLSVLKQENPDLSSAYITMKAHNPCLIPRNSWVEEVIAAGERHNLEPMNRMLELLANPYAYTEEQLAEAAKPVDNSAYVTYCGT